jgi:CelD/BcsL family acetyltransferase involved in cellulose biosynthesis
LFEVARIPQFDFLSPDYRALFGRSDATAFQHPIWLDCVCGRLAPKLGIEATAVTVRSRSDGRLVLVLPLLTRRFGPLRLAEFADLGVADYCALVCDREAGPAVMDDEETRRRIREMLRPFDLIRTRKIRDDSAFPAELLGSSSKSFMGFHSHEVPIFGPFAAWRRATLEPQFASFLDKKRKRLGKKGQIRFEQTTEPNAIVAAFEHMRAFRRKRFEGRRANDLLQDANFLDFYADVAVRGLDEGLSRLYLLSLDERPLAAIFGLSDGRRFMYLLVGYDVGDFRSYSLGLLIVEDLIRDCIERGEAIFDLTIGDEPYKKKFAARPAPMFSAWTANGAAGALAGTALDGYVWARKVSKRFLQKSRAEA